IYKNGELNTWRYWTTGGLARPAKEQSYADTCKATQELLYAAVERRLVADVPFGAFLSGGIDSSAVVGMMSRLLSRKVDTFNISFDESEFSEALYAKQIAEKFNTNHHEIKLSPADFLTQLPEALAALDHPSGDGPNTYIVSKATKQAGVTMALSGLGGDELFAGYDVFKRMLDTEKKAYLNAFPLWMRKLSGAAIQAKKGSVAGEKINELLSQEKISVQTAYAITRKVYSNPQLKKLLKLKEQKHTLQQFIDSVPKPSGDHKLSYVSQLEMGSYMQNILLRDADQMSMAVALEVRVPFLDYKLVEYVLSVNDTYKFPSTPKKLLIDSLGDLLPPEIINRPKMGFTLPWKHWLKNELKSFCEQRLDALKRRDFSNGEGIAELWNGFLKDDPKVSWSRIWHLVVLENWLQANAVN
ncbi:MAG: asparagine synthetase B family protein, partial [Bacteroidia bacterium]